MYFKKCSCRIKVRTQRNARIAFRPQSRSMKEGWVVSKKSSIILRKIQ
jgi:hypothetical protein